ncbi:MAG TPA: tetratricopeptide repeat protein, partial [Dehalococcoidia bacterium]|nr:tetratricopeptide repeat protein [Dehalococcoidia bacterium]
MAARSGTGRVRDSSDLTPFVGRAHERAELRKLLTSGSALVTLTGTGGSGKTRLADVLLADLVGCFPAGVHRIALESLSDPALLQQTVAGALGLREEPGRPLLAGLVERLAGEPRLLLLDNCEHLLSACADLAAALRVGCPELRLLATSREALGLPGERVWPLAPLVLPAAPRPGAAADPATVAGSEAAQLFVLRARRLLPEFAVTAENAAAIVATCRQLDGLPLALELAAARLRFLSPAQLAARLAQRFRLLTGGDASVPRQQTLRAAIDWSYSLLSEPEQALFCRLGVFAGSFTLEAVEAVMPPGALGGAYPLDVLERLVERSLVVAERSGEAVRFRMLESLRVYAAERLAEAGAAEEAAHAHLTFYLALAEAAAQELAGEQQARRLRELDAEQDNLRAALAFAAEALPEAGLRIAAALARYWELRGWLREGRAWLERLLERAPDVPPALLARALTRAAGLAHRQSDYAGARRLLDQALAVCRTRGAESELVTVLRQLTFTARLQLDYETARAAAQEALAVLGPSGPPVPRASLLNELGAIAHMYDEPAAAVRYLREGLALCRSVGEVQGTAVTLDNLARVLWDLDQEEEALALAQEALALHRQIGNELGAAGVLSTLAQFALDRDEPGRAERYRHEALALYRAAGNLHGAAMSVYNLGHIAFSRGDLATAARRFDEALGEAVAMN